MSNRISNRLDLIFAFLIALSIGMIGCGEAYAGTGYIDRQGKWHFSVAFAQSSTGQPIDETEWLEVFKAANEMLYRATKGRHQIGTITLISGVRYDAMADVIIVRDPDRSYADVNGIGRFGYHIFLSEGLRTQYNRAERAKLFLHSLGHYLYSLYDEFRNKDGITLCCPPPPLPKTPQCVWRNFSNTALDDAACLMEKFRPEASIWCYDENHEISLGSTPLARTWQTQDNDSLSCWSTMKRLYPSLVLLGDPPLPDTVNLGNFSPLSSTPNASTTELVIALDGSLLSNPRDRAFVFTAQIILRALASIPDVQGRVAFVSYNGGQVVKTEPLLWNDELRKTFLTIIPSLQPLPGANLDDILQNVYGAFQEIANQTGGVAGVSRTLLWLSRGSEKPELRNRSILNDIRNQHVRATVGLVEPAGSVPDTLVKTLGKLADEMGGLIYDATIPSVRAYMSTEAASKQTITVDGLVITSPGEPKTFEHTVSDEIQSLIVSVNWFDPDCEVAVTILRNGQGGPITGDNTGDFVGPALRARRYANVLRDERLTIEVQAPSGCAMPLPVTIAISDENPQIFLSVISERPVYGNIDNQVVHGLVHAPYPLFNLDEFVTGQLDTLGQFLGLPESCPDDGISNIGTTLFNGDWIKGDGVHSKVFRGLGRFLLRTVKFRAINLGQARYVPGEEFSNGGATTPIPRFRREAFVTYLVDTNTPTNLTLDVFGLDSIPWPPTTLDFEIPGQFHLPSHYPHAYEISGKILGAKMRIDANSFSVDLRDLISDLTHIPSLDSIKLGASLRVLFKTGDSLVAAGVIVGVDEKGRSDGEQILPAAFQLYPNFPNPFNLGTEFVFDLPKLSQVTLAIYDVMGRRIATVFAGKKHAGQHRAYWNSRTDLGELAGSGVYFAHLTAGEWRQVRKIVLMK